MAEDQKARDDLAEGLRLRLVVLLFDISLLVTEAGRDIRDMPDMVSSNDEEETDVQ